MTAVHDPEKQAAWPPCGFAALSRDEADRDHDKREFENGNDERGHIREVR
jgi:hypothetical protein